MLTPRFALNTYTIGGVIFLVVGVGLVIGARMIPEGAFVMRPMGIGFASMGLLWTVLAGRRGRLRPPRGLAADGTRTKARLSSVVATRSTTRSGEYGPIISQVFKLELDVDGPQGPYAVRIYRSLRGNEIPKAIEGSTVPVAVDPSNQRKVAILWDEITGIGGYGVAAAPTDAVPVRVAGVTPVGTGHDGTAALQVVVELPGSRFAQGVVAGPPGRTPGVGEQVRAQLDASGTQVVSIRW